MLGIVCLYLAGVDFWLFNYGFGQLVVDCLRVGLGYFVFGRWFLVLFFGFALDCLVFQIALYFGFILLWLAYRRLV